MNTGIVSKATATSIIGLFLILGTCSIVLAQKRGESNQPSSLQNSRPSPPRQQIYRQQQTQNQQRFEQRSQKYQHDQEARSTQKQPDQQERQIQTRQEPIIGQVRQQPEKQGLPNQPKRLAFRQRQIDQKEGRQIQAQQQQWHQFEQTWQNNYSSRWTSEQTLFEQREQILRRQNRREEIAFQEAYWERVNEDRNRLQEWRFYNDVALNYSYLRNGSYYYTSEYGMNLLLDAVNDGYQEGYLAGQSDREDRWKSSYQDAFAYQDASYGYNGYWISLDEYQHYFRQGFQRGYEDGFNDRYRYGRFYNGNYLMLDGPLKGIIDFSLIVG